MQISCIQKHLGVFFSQPHPLFALHQPPFHVSLFIHQPSPLFFSFQGQFLHPSILSFFSFFPPLFNLIFTLHLYSAFTSHFFSRCRHSFLQSSSVPLFLPSTSSPSVAVYLVGCLFYSLVFGLFKGQ